MKVFRVAYNNETKFILDILETIEAKGFILETFNANKRKEKKTVSGIQTDLGTRNLPLIQILDENLELIDAIWSEHNPDWKQVILSKIENLC